MNEVYKNAPDFGDDLSSYADEMVNTIRSIIRQETNTMGLGNSSSSQLASAVVSKVNEDGSVDVYFPPNVDGIFTKISNQTTFPLAVGDCVEIMLKDGSFSNCWICAKHLERNGNGIIKTEAKILEDSIGDTDFNLQQLQEKHEEEILNLTLELEDTKAKLENTTQTLNATIVRLDETIEKLNQLEQLVNTHTTDIQSLSNRVSRLE